MFRVCKQFLRKLPVPRQPVYSARLFSSDSDGGGEERRPQAGEYRSPWKILKQEAQSVISGKSSDDMLVPRETDILVIGGGLVGSSVAFWLKQRSPEGISVTVVERDPSYTQASSMLSVGGIRHQFTIPENVQMSMFTTQFLRNIREHLSVLDQDPPDVQFSHHGYMFLVPEDRADNLANCVRMQRDFGAKVVLLSKTQLANKFPWLNLDGIDCGSCGMEGEGWFDPWMLLRALKMKNLSLGVQYVNGTVEKFNFTEKYIPSSEGYVKAQDLSGVDVRHSNGNLYGCRFAMAVNCAGPWAGHVADLAGIGTGEQEMSVRLPVEPRKRFVYVFHCPDGPGIETPLTVDPTGVYFRREGLGGMYVCGSSPLSDEEEPDITNLDVDYDFYQDYVWPQLANLVPKFENSKLKNAWAGYYDYNTLDQNLVIGNHPRYSNFLFANGMSGHGAQQAVAIGRGIMELIFDNDYKTIDLSRFSFSRFILNEPVRELAVV